MYIPLECNNIIYHMYHLTGGATGHIAQSPA